MQIPNALVSGALVIVLVVQVLGGEYDYQDLKP